MGLAVTLSVSPPANTKAFLESALLTPATPQASLPSWLLKAPATLSWFKIGWVEQHPPLHTLCLHGISPRNTGIKKNTKQEGAKDPFHFPSRNPKPEEMGGKVPTKVPWWESGLQRTPKKTLPRSWVGHSLSPRQYFREWHDGASKLQILPGMVPENLTFHIQSHIGSCHRG